MKLNEKHIPQSGTILVDGYLYIIANRDHPNKTKKGYIPLHRSIIECKLGRYLNKHEEVHHKDGNRLNNLPSNLKLMTISEHKKLHYKERFIDDKGRFCREGDAIP